MTEMQQWLYRIQPVRATMLAEGSTPQEDEITRQHFAYLKQLTETGTVILAGRTLNSDYSSFGIIIFKAADEAAAWAIVNGDPAVKARHFRPELYPYRVALLGAENV
jgi:uncharacterized protein YciI